MEISLLCPRSSKAPSASETRLAPKPMPPTADTLTPGMPAPASSRTWPRIVMPCVTRNSSRVRGFLTLASSGPSIRLPAPLGIAGAYMDVPCSGWLNHSMESIPSRALKRASPASSVRPET
jgi:hypothetical protein